MGASSTPTTMLPAIFGMFSVLAAAIAAALAAGVVLRRKERLNMPYVAALGGTALWLVIIAFYGPVSAIGWIGEAARNLLWLWYMASIAGQRMRRTAIGAVGWIYIFLFAIEAMLAMLIAGRVIAGSTLSDPSQIVDTLHMLFAAGAIVLLHNLYDAGSADERRGLAMQLAALTAMWGYDLNLFAISYLSGEPAVLLLELRPLAQAGVLTAFVVAAFRPKGQAVRLSRPAAFRSLALAVIGGWLALLATFAALAGHGGNFAGYAQNMVLTGGLVLGAVFAASPRIRALLKVWAAKHFFEHRYDYRAEWLRFSATMNRPESGGLAIDAHCVKAFADMVESPGGVLLSMVGGGEAVASGGWPPDALPLPENADWEGLFQWLAQSERIIQFDEIRAGLAPQDEMAAVCPTILARQEIWIGVPLLHLDKVEGVVLLARPLVDRALDWEDFDLLKVAGRQAASHLAEARAAMALAESARFEEFHRRFAFMMHDVKNLASQMALLARNAERHGDNPAFRQDMVETLRLSAERLAQLMERLSGQERVRIEGVAPTDVAAVARRIVNARGHLHPVQFHGADNVTALAEPETLEQLLVHLVQNAVDASGADAPVILSVSQQDDDVCVIIEDHGCGMSQQFVRTELFRPFSSTKEGGFGIGAYQALQLAQAMGGDLSVISREGEGTQFTLRLRAAAPHQQQESEAA